MRASAILVGPLGQRRKHTMRKLLMVGTALVAVSLAMPAFAHDDDGGSSGGPYQPRPTFEVSLAAALAGNSGNVAGNSASIESQNTSASISNGSYNGAKGVSNTNQNAGANSALQNALAISYIQGCACATTPSSGYTVAAGAALAAAGNGGEVENNTSTSRREIIGHYYVQKPWRRDGDDRDDFFKVPIWGADNYVTASINGSFNNSTGVFQVNQNAGDNSLLQNAAAVTAATHLQGKALDAGAAIAMAGNGGEVEDNGASADHTHASASMTGSFSNDTGVVSANQNAGANSQLQNSAAVASLQFCGCAQNNLSLSVAAAGNEGGVYGNQASAENGSNGASMNNSFVGSTGVMSANQNAGANSLLQNSVAVGVITHATPQGD